MNDSKIIVQADKTVIKIHNLSVKGLNTQELENILINKLESMVRVIGVTGSSLEMDVYGLDEEAILKNEAGFIQAISLAEGITASEVTAIAYAKKICDVDFDHIPPKEGHSCMKERWLQNVFKSDDPSHRG